MTRIFAPLPTTPGGWKCFAADCPWTYQDKGSRLAPDQRVKRANRKGYRTLSTEEIMRLPVGEVAARDAFLFLWTTDAHLEVAHAVARAWTFEPLRTWTWVKASPPAEDLRAFLAGLREELPEQIRELHRMAAPADAPAIRWVRGLERELGRVLRASERDLHLGKLAFGGGHYVRTATERLLICRRGRAQFLVHDERDVFFAPRRKGGTGEIHSTKPLEIFPKIERVCSGPRLELFARDAQPGWEVWGDQAPRRAA